MYSEVDALNLMVMGIGCRMVDLNMLAICASSDQLLQLAIVWKKWFPSHPTLFIFPLHIHVPPTINVYLWSILSCMISICIPLSTWCCQPLTIYLQVLQAILHYFHSSPQHHPINILYSFHPIYLQSIPFMWWSQSSSRIIFLSIRIITKL